MARERKSRTNLRREDGQALVELALVVPLLLFIIFAIIDFGLAINQYNNTTNLANLGARATAVLSSSNTTPGTCTYTKSGTSTTYTTLVGYIDCEGATEGAAEPGHGHGVRRHYHEHRDRRHASVRVVSSFNWLGILAGGIGRIGGVTGGASNVTIGSTAAMRMEGSATTRSATWLEADANHDIPGTSSTVPAPTITTSGC